MVVLVVDEARSLLRGRSDDGLNLFRKLRKALVFANMDIDGGGGVFAVLVDRNSKISDLSPPWVSDPSFKHKCCRDVLRTRRVLRTTSSDSEEEEKDDSDSTGSQVKGEEEEVTMEDEIAEYKHIVTRRGKTKAQNALLRMGRPMCIEKRNYTEETMFGVASILCRLGVRPLSTSALASRVVADFMAILVYVNYEMDGYLSTYASDPVFTLGAIKVWYELKNGLAKYILLQLEKLILKETLDTGGVGEMVARILLLLAMDTCVLGGGGDSPDYNRIGQFVPLETFLEKFITEDMPIYYEGKKNPLALDSNEDTLWYLLGRRAAGILPRNQDAAELITPIFKKCLTCRSNVAADEKTQEEVSLALIQVKNRSSNDREVSTDRLTPTQKSVCDVIRINIGVFGEPEGKHRVRFIYATPLDGSVNS
ncbi:hypothetical protein DVH05_021834 [Phytophthora capsici]|nr:hypothetical protein DVH05_021834 [Phytophthora capsici]